LKEPLSSTFSACAENSAGRGSFFCQLDSLQPFRLRIFIRLADEAAEGGDFAARISAGSLLLRAAVFGVFIRLSWKTASSLILRMMLGALQKPHPPLRAYGVVQRPLVRS